MRGSRGSEWRQALTSLAMQTGRHTARPGSRAVPVRRDGDGDGYRRRRRGEQPMVPDAEFSSYYGRPVIKEPVWRTPDVPAYLFLGGLAGASSVLAAGAFAGSAASAAGGLGLLAVHSADAEPARDLAILGATVELIAKRQLLARLGDLAEPYEAGTTGAILRLAEFLTAGALAGAVLGGRSRAVSALSGASLVAASAMTTYGIFKAGMASARDPKYTIVPQRHRRDQRGMK